jgi:hypothetical protein
MGVNGNGVGRANGSAASAQPPAGLGGFDLAAAWRANGSAAPAQPPAPAKGVDRNPRRLVLLAGEPNGPVEEVLAEYQGADVSGNRLHADLQRLSEEHTSRYVAAEWHGPLGWTRFLWRRKDEPRL